MKPVKTKSGVFVCLAAFILAALFTGIAFPWTAARAEESYAMNAENFIYSAELTPGAGARKASLVFGADGNGSDWKAVADAEGGKIALVRDSEGETELRSAVYSFSTGSAVKFTVVVNEGVAKIFADDDVAIVTCKLDGYSGGGIKAEKDGEFTVGGESFTDTDAPYGDIYFGSGYNVLKVVNLTDGNAMLADKADYEFEGGALTVKESYLETLEAGREYLFRAVTSFTDFNFRVTADFTSVTAKPAVEKYYRDTDVVFELSDSVEVTKLLIDGKQFGFAQNDTRVTLSAADANTLTVGEHSVKLFTKKGRPDTSVTVSEAVETLVDIPEESTHLFLWIDIAIFGTAIIGYAAYSIISKTKKK